MDKVRFGVVGFGNMGSGHMKYLSSGEVEGASVEALCDINPEKLEAAKQKYPSVRMFGDMESMLNNAEVDAVLIATPHYDHPSLAIHTLRRGIHTLFEKPAGVYTKQVQEMNREAEK